MTKGKSTIRDVARISNVSISTVSRVLSGSEYPVSAELRQKVQKTAEEIGYIPNHFGRRLRGADRNEIGILVPSFSNTFYGNLLSSLNALLHQNNFFPIVCMSKGTGQSELEQVYRLLARDVSGILLTNSYNEDRIADLLHQRGTPFVILESTKSENSYPSVYFDFKRAGILAANYLLETGHRNIHFVTPSFKRESRKLIWQGLLMQQKEYQMTNPAQTVKLKAHVLDKDENKLSDEAIVDHLTEMILRERDGVDSIVANNDTIAIPLMFSLQKYGISIPEDLSIIGFDDLPIARYITPQLTTLRQNVSLISEYALEMLCDLMADKSPCSRVIYPELIIRDSVKDRR